MKTVIIDSSSAILRKIFEPQNIKADTGALIGRCDSFVVETDVHFPTDINLLFDAVRKMIQIAAIISQGIGSAGIYMDKGSYSPPRDKN